MAAFTLNQLSQLYRRGEMNAEQYRQARAELLLSLDRAVEVVPHAGSAPAVAEAPDFAGPGKGKLRLFLAGAGAGLALLAVFLFLFLFQGEPEQQVAPVEPLPAAQQGETVPDDRPAVPADTTARQPVPVPVPAAMPKKGGAVGVAPALTLTLQASPKRFVSDPVKTGEKGAAAMTTMGKTPIVVSLAGGGISDAPAPAAPAPAAPAAVPAGPARDGSGFRPAAPQCADAWFSFAGVSGVSLQLCVQGDEEAIRALLAEATLPESLQAVRVTGHDGIWIVYDFPASPGAAELLADRLASRLAVLGGAQQSLTVLDRRIDSAKGVK